MNRYFAALLTAASIAVLPVALTPAAQADDVCDVYGCIDVGPAVEVGHDVEVGAVAVADVADAAAQAAAGRPPCYTPAGLPYYTPGDAPCN